ncbi:MAG: hypothetical protein ACTS6H_02995 [Candidatus Hodgkinia cicadicola]
MRCGINSHVTSDFRRRLSDDSFARSSAEAKLMLRNETTIAGCFSEVWTAQRNVILRPFVGKLLSQR